MIMIRTPARLLILLAAVGCVVPEDASDTGWADSGHGETGLIDTSSDTHDTGATGDTADSCVVDTAMDSADTGETGDTAETGDTGEIVETGETGDTFDTGEERILPSGPIRIYAVRHAEKESEGDDPGLTEEGLARADALAELLHDVHIDAVYASELIRTQQTVQPTADDHGLEVICDIDPEYDLAEYILLNHGDDTVLHAGHSYTLPNFMEQLGIEDLPDSYDYGDLWIIQVEVDGSVIVEESHFGE